MDDSRPRAEPNRLSGVYRFSTRPRVISWVIPGSLAVIGVLPLLSLRWRSDVLVILGAVLAVAAYLMVQLLISRLWVDGDVLCVRHDFLRMHCVRLFGLRSVAARRVRFSKTPALELTALDGARVTIRLGAWRHEEEFLGILAEVVARSDTSVDAETAEILRDRPSEGSWALRNAGNPTTALERGWARIPSPIRWILWLVLSLATFVAIYVILVLVAVIGENVLFPRQIDPAWTTSYEVPIGPADTWVGNVAVSGGRIVLATREDIDGFWGTMKGRTSSDHGATWSSPVAISGAANAARHTMVSAGGDSLWAAWSERGPAPATQRLVVRTSADAGASWAPPVDVATPAGGLVGLPALVASDLLRLVVYTDGQSGEIWAQPLSADAHGDGPPTRIGVASRDLYYDAAFIDAHIALSGIGGRAVIAYVEGDHRLRVATSDDGGRSWQAHQIDQDLYSGRPRLATDGSTTLLAVSDPDSSARNVRRPFIRIWLSVDAGVTWVRGPDIADAVSLGSLDLTWAGGQWRLLYDACPGFLRCATPTRIWYATSVDGTAWSDPVVISQPANVEPIGVASDDAGIFATWAIKRSDHDWQLFVSRQSRS